MIEPVEIGRIRASFLNDVKTTIGPGGAREALRRMRVALQERIDAECKGAELVELEDPPSGDRIFCVALPEGAEMQPAQLARLKGLAS